MKENKKRLEWKIIGKQNLAGSFLIVLMKSSQCALPIKQIQEMNVGWSRLVLWQLIRGARGQEKILNVAGSVPGLRKLTLILVNNKAKRSLL